MWRRQRPLAALAMILMVVTVGAISAGCGSSAPSETGAAGSADTASGAGGNANATERDKAVKFAECMRGNGVKAFPDPDASGQLTLDGIANGSTLDTNSAPFKQAMSACKDLEPPGFAGHTRSVQEQANALAFAQCVRDNGVKDFPDPGPDDPMVDTNRIPSTERSGGMSILNAAMHKCSGLAAAAGVAAGK